MIPLTENLVLSAEDRCFVVGRARRERGKGVELLDRTYHATAAQAVLSAVSRTMRKGVADSSITSLRQFIEEQQRLQAELERLIAPLEPGQPPQQTDAKREV